MKTIYPLLHVSSALKPQESFGGLNETLLVLSWSHVRVFVGGLTHAAEVRRNPVEPQLPPLPRKRIYEFYYDEVLLFNIHE